MVRNSYRALVFAALPVALASCGKHDDANRNLDSLDNELIAAGNGNAQDPAMTSALQSEIMVDPALAHKANNDAIRPPAQPYSGAVPPTNIAATPAGAGVTTGPGEPLKSTLAAAGSCPQCKAHHDSLTLGALASRQPDGRTRSCAGALRYSAGWANRLPADLPLYPDARVIEAAGSADGACNMRAVSFSTAAALQHVMDWYYTRASKAGYAAEQQADGGQHVLGGTRTRDGGAFAIFFTGRRDGGTDVDLIANTGN